MLSNQPPFPNILLGLCMDSMLAVLIKKFKKYSYDPFFVCIVFPQGFTAEQDQPHTRASFLSPPKAWRIVSSFFFFIEQTNFEETNNMTLRRFSQNAICNLVLPMVTIESCGR